MRVVACGERSSSTEDGYRDLLRGPLSPVTAVISHGVLLLCLFRCFCYVCVGLPLLHLGVREMHGNADNSHEPLGFPCYNIFIIQGLW